jgi:hypothetical protein
MNVKVKKIAIYVERWGFVGLNVGTYPCSRIGVESKIKRMKFTQLSLVIYCGFKTYSNNGNERLAKN